MNEFKNLAFENKLNIKELDKIIFSENDDIPDFFNIDCFFKLHNVPFAFVSRIPIDIFNDDFSSAREIIINAFEIHKSFIEENLFEHVNNLDLSGICHKIEKISYMTNSSISSLSTFDNKYIDRFHSYSNENRKTKMMSLFKLGTSPIEIYQEMIFKLDIDNFIITDSDIEEFLLSESLTKLLSKKNKTTKLV